MLDKVCVQMGKLAEAVMRSRQSGAAIQELLDSQERHFSPDVVRDLRQMTLQAYSVPRYADAQGQDVAITNFRDANQLECLGAQQAVK
ncbi:MULTISPECIES: hypothetical protein [unclassified Mesorhizobium]|uniref:hypothetical protein n=1 Tax=unclassified Mesorhizobium TaxID=325217 RepID=UPI0012ECB618|nr:hypothetical protein [Mesorhizobium sp. LSJC268A00]